MTDNTKPRLLLVDDELAHLDALHRALAQRGLWVHQAHNVQLAMSALARQTFDLVVLDVKLAGDDVVDLLTHIRCVYPELPVVLLHSHGTGDAAFDRTREGVLACLPKPCDVERLARIARQVRGPGRPPASAEPASAEPVRPSTTLLIIGHDSALQASLGQTLAPRGISTTAASSAGEAWQLLEQRRFDVVMLDFTLPDMDGLELSRRIKRARPSTGILFFTAHPTMQRTLSGLRAGASDVLVKPQDPDILAYHVRRARRTTSRDEQHQPPRRHAG